MWRMPPAMQSEMSKMQRFRRPLCRRKVWSPGLGPRALVEIFVMRQHGCSLSCTYSCHAGVKTQQRVGRAVWEPSLPPACTMPEAMDFQRSACFGSEAEATAGSVRTATRHYGAELKHVYGDSCLDSTTFLLQTLQTIANSACALHSRQVKLQFWRHSASHLYEAVMQVLEVKHVYTSVAVSGYVAIACLTTVYHPRMCSLSAYTGITQGKILRGERLAFKQKRPRGIMATCRKHHGVELQ